MANKAWIKEKLIENADKNFVQRLFKKDAPQMDLGEGRYATHQMAWSHTGDPSDPKTKIIVYPNIIWNAKQKGLNWLNGREARDYAIKSKEYIEVDSPEEAEDLSTNYKEVVPGFNDRAVSGGGGPGSMSYQIAPTEEQKLKTKANKIKLGLMSKPKEKKNGR